MCEHQPGVMQFLPVLSHSRQTATTSGAALAVLEAQPTCEETVSGKASGRIYVGIVTGLSVACVLPKRACKGGSPGHMVTCAGNAGGRRHNESGNLSACTRPGAVASVLRRTICAT